MKIIKLCFTYGIFFYKALVVLWHLETKVIWFHKHNPTPQGIKKDYWSNMTIHQELKVFLEFQ